MRYSDEEIVELVLAGEKELYAMLIERYQGPIYNLMYRYSQSREEAADLSQDVFLRAFDRLASHRRSSRFFSWLYRLAVNRAEDWVRKQRRRRSRQVLLKHSSREHEEDWQQDRLESQEELALVGEALQELPAHLRETLILRYRHGRSILEVAEIFNLSQSAVKMRLKRGLEQLRASLSRQGEKENGL